MTGRSTLRCTLPAAGIDYVPMDTSVSFDKALMEYLLLGRTIV